MLILNRGYSYEKARSRFDSSRWKGNGLGQRGKSREIYFMPGVEARSEDNDEPVEGIMAYT